MPMYCITDQTGQTICLYIWSAFARPLVKKPDYKVQIIAKKNFNLMYSINIFY